jgi:hypothetical protein
MLPVAQKKDGFSPLEAIFLQNIAIILIFCLPAYLAMLTALFSRITVTFIWPG